MKSYLENIFIGKWLDIKIFCLGLDGFNIHQRIIRETTLSLTEYVLFYIEVIFLQLGLHFCFLVEKSYRWFSSTIPNPNTWILIYIVLLYITDFPHIWYKTFKKYIYCFQMQRYR